MATVAELKQETGFTVRDVSGQRVMRIATFTSGATVGDMVRDTVRSLGLGARDSAGRDLTYQARLDREGRHLHSSEAVQDVVREGDEIVLHPSIAAGRR